MKGPNLKWIVALAVFAVLVVLVIALRDGPDDAVKKYLNSISDMEYSEAASLHMNDDGS